MTKSVLQSVAAFAAAFAAGAPALACPVDDTTKFEVFCSDSDTQGAVIVEGSNNVVPCGPVRVMRPAAATDTLAEAPAETQTIRGVVAIGGSVRIIAAERARGVQHGVVTAVAVGPGARARVSSAVMTPAE